MDRYTFGEPDFFDVIRLLDKVQLTKKNNLMNSTVVSKALRLSAIVECHAEQTYVQAVSGFTRKDSKYVSKCASLILHTKNLSGVYVRCGSVSWITAPEYPNGRGFTYTISCINPVHDAQHIASFFTGWTEVNSGDAKHLIFQSN